MRTFHLDTNVLIALSDPTSSLFAQVEARLRDGQQAATSVVAWHEYACGPLLAEDRNLALQILESRVVSLTRPMAELAAELFNATGRRRASTADCLIAASAICSDAELITHNHSDFTRFEPHGLVLCGDA